MPRTIHHPETTMPAFPTVTRVVVAGNRTVHAGRLIGRYASGNPRYAKRCAGNGSARHEPQACAPETPITCKRCLASLASTEQSTTRTAQEIILGVDAKTAQALRARAPQSTTNREDATMAKQQETITPEQKAAARSAAAKKGAATRAAKKAAEAPAPSDEQAAQLAAAAGNGTPEPEPQPASEHNTEAVVGRINDAAQTDPATDPVNENGERPSEAAMRIVSENDADAKKQAAARKRQITAALKKLNGQKVNVALLAVDGEQQVRTGKLTGKDEQGRIVVGRFKVPAESVEGITSAEPQPEPAAGTGDTPAKQTPEQRTAEVAEIAGKLPEHITRYVEQHGSADALAPMHGDPFVQAGRVFLQLEGRGGTGKGADVERETGLRPFLKDTNGGLGEAPKMVLKDALEQLGFSRKPFGYRHPDRGQTSASYYSAPQSVIQGVAMEDRHTPREVKREARTAVGVSSASVPPRPRGDEPATAKLDELWAAYNEAREAWKQAAMKRPVEAARAKAAKDKLPAAEVEQRVAEAKAGLDELQGATRAAQAELLDWRQTMVKKFPQGGEDETS